MSLPAIVPIAVAAVLLTEGLFCAATGRPALASLAIAWAIMLTAIAAHTASERKGLL